MAHLVIATDQEKLLTGTLNSLGKIGVSLRSTTSWSGLLAALTDENCVLALIDGKLPGLDPSLLVRLLSSLGHQTRIRSIGSPIAGIKRSPVGETALIRLVNRHSERVLDRDSLKEIALMGLGEHPFARLSRTAQQHLPIRIEGELGTNKEAVARAIHALRGAQHPFVKKHPGDIGSLPGKTGTVYLKNIDQWNHQDLQIVYEMAAKGQWRIISGTRGTATDDGKTWLNIGIVPIRNRKGDLEALSRLYIARYRREFELPTRRFDKSMWALMRAYRWPKNARELEHFIVQVLSNVQSSTIRAKNLPVSIRELVEPKSRIAEISDGFEELVEARLRNIVAGIEKGARVPLHRISVQATEKALIRLSLSHTGGDQKAAAELLGVARNTLRTKAQAYGLLTQKKKR